MICFMFTHQRQQEIINILLQDQKWHTLEEIAEQAHCAIKTVRRDLHYLKGQLPLDWHIQLMKGRGVKLHKPPHSSLTSLYSFFKREDMLFLVLDQLFQGQVHTITQLAESLYVQVSTLSPVLCRIQNYLCYFDLELHKKPLRIVGMEVHIVYMFYEFYFTTYGWERWPFPEEVDVFSYISQIEKKLDIQFYPSYKQRLAYLIAVAVRRKKQGHEMKISPIYAEMIMEMSFYQEIKTLPMFLCNVSLTKTDQIFITIAVNCCMFVHSNRNQYKQDLLQHFHKGASTLHQSMHDLIGRLEKEFNMPFHQDDEFLFCLLQYMRQVFYRNQFIPSLTSPSSDWQEQIKQKHAQTFQKVRSVYTAWKQEYSFLYQANEEDILAITLQLEATFQLTQNYRKKVILYLGDCILWKRYIQGVLYHEFGNTLFIIPEEVLDIHKCDLQQFDIDGIISTVPLKEINISSFQISVVPTRRELNDIHIFLYTK